ncbi:MAG: DUF1328 domain-containing protein [Candidatus Omnitrophota bacterium]
MFVWSFLLLFIAVIAGLFSFAGLVPASAFFAKALFFIFLIIFVVVVMGRAFRSKA